MSSGAALDTIVAPATPVGRSALAIVRIDGPRSGDILRQLSGGVLPEPRVATLTRLDGIDECIAVRYAAPHSFTGNDLVELTLHGNPLLVAEVIAWAVAHGARIAEPGEFTERAVLNGKLDLVQAESVADLINARTPLQAKLSLGNLEGSLSRTAAAIRESLLFVISRLEAALDFSEEGYEFITADEVRTRLDAAIRDTHALAETYRRGRATTAGLTLVILGRPNAGKSTLLNRLVGTDRAIVTPIPGTTRDIVRETIEIGGLPVTIADTAGLRTGGDVVEEIGIERARSAARSADLILYLVDATTGITEADRSELAALAGQEVLVVYTKGDLAVGTKSDLAVDTKSDLAVGTKSDLAVGTKSDLAVDTKSDLAVDTKSDLAAAPAGELAISVPANEGIDRLLARLDTEVREHFAAPEGSAVIVNERQRQAVAGCDEALRAAVASVEAGMDEQIVLVDLYRASTSLGLLTGAITKDDVFTEIFTKFCIGK